MKISDLIECLGEIQRAHGDLEIEIAIATYAGLVIERARAVGTNVGEYKQFVVISNQE